MKTKPAFALNAKELEIGFISQPVVDVDYASDPFLPIDPTDALESGLFAHNVFVFSQTGPFAECRDAKLLHAIREHGSKTLCPLCS